ncbi:MAG TPA: hypothetical protein VGJ63_16900 [Micromonosporaceae bacterium]
MLAGLVIGLILTEVMVAVTVPKPSEVADSPSMAVLLGLAPPALAVAGAVATPLIARRMRVREYSQANPSGRD